MTNQRKTHDTIAWCHHFYSSSGRAIYTPIYIGIPLHHIPTLSTTSATVKNNGLYYNSSLYEFWLIEEQLSFGSCAAIGQKQIPLYIKRIENGCPCTVERHASLCLSLGPFTSHRHVQGCRQAKAQLPLIYILQGQQFLIHFVTWNITKLRK